MSKPGENLKNIGIDIDGVHSWTQQYIKDFRQKGMLPIVTDVNSTNPSITKISKVDEEQYDLLEYVTDCVLDGVISRPHYIKLRALIRSKDESNWKLVRNILDARCQD